MEDLRDTRYSKNQMFYIFPLLVIIFSSLGIFFILWRRDKSLSREVGDSLIYPEIDDEPKEVRDNTTPIERKEEGFFITKSFNSMIKNFIRQLITAASLLGKVKVIVSHSKLRQTKVKVNKIEEKPAMSTPNISEAGIDIQVISSANPLSLLKDDSSEFDEQYWIDVLKQDRESSFPCKKLGEIYIARGDFREARAILKYALKLDPNDDGTKSKLAELRGKRTKLIS